MQFREQFLQEDREYIKSIVALTRMQTQMPLYEIEQAESVDISGQQTDLFKEISLIKQQTAVLFEMKNTVDSMQIDIKRSKYDKLDLQIILKEVQVENGEIAKKIVRLEPKIDELQKNVKRLEKAFQI